MIVQKLFEKILSDFQPFLGNVNLVMAIVALLCLAMGSYYSIKKETYGKYLSLGGCLLMINPVIYFLTN